MRKKNRSAPKTVTDFDPESESFQRKKWFEEIAEDPKDFKPVTEQILIELKEEAKKCHDAEVANYNIKNSKSNSDYKWMKTVMSKGTVSDKIAASVVAIQDNPVCSLDTLQNLVNMVKVGKKKECVTTIDTLTELFLSDLLRPDQKLKAFHQRPLALLQELSSGNAITRRKLLSNWYFEDQLKELYTTFVLALNNVAHDVLDNNKEKAISSMYKLLAGNPEQEKNLLTYLVNKLGDPSQKVASKAIYSLGQLLFKHPNMQGVVLSEVEKLLFRSNISPKAQYYGLCFLSQFYLSHESNEVARRLIEVYFSFFKACVKKGEIDSRMMSALLMGVNRAYPYAKLEMEKISEHIDTMYRVVHIANFNISLHALSLLYQVSDHHNNVTDRFYSALYKKLIDPKLFTTTHQAMLLSLIYKALLKDTETTRIKVFVKRLLQLSLLMQPAFACGVLYLISQLMGKKQNIQSLVLKQTVLKNDGSDDEDEERYHDVKDDEIEIKQEDEEGSGDDIKPDVSVLNHAIKPSWDHCANSSKKEKSPTYNALSRNPLYAGGDFCAYTELFDLKNHFHPTVALYATNILDGNIIKYSGDPLKDFTLIRFLDRFVFKNPKKYEEGTVQGAHPTFGKRKLYLPKGLRSLRVNSANYLNEDSKNIPVDEMFMYSYLRKKYHDREQDFGDKSDEDDSDLESVQSEEFEEMLEKMAGLPKDDEEDLDFLNDVGDNLKTNGKSQKDKKRTDDDDSDDDDSEMEDASDEELSMDEDEDFDEDDLEMNDDDKMLLGDLDDDEDEEVVFDDEEPKSAKSKKKKSKDTNSIFASAEEFASLLDDEGSSKIAPGSSNALSNKDNASTKQLAWEQSRNRWLKGFDEVVGKKKNSKGSNFGKKRKGPNKFNNKAKKRKN
ncbi:CCAAT/enhancer-binding protein zeta [Tribolium castaneum]|uniref:CCAAT/enhancer-binding protein zeta n=1 Tax=Tribolium castaneum TaxID=7070 RepID=UPI0030FE5A21